MITTIIFDLAEVYLDGLKGLERRLEHLMDIPLDEIKDGFHIDELHDFFRGEITEEEYWKTVLEKNNWDISPEILKEKIRENFQEIEGTREIIEKLKDGGYKLGLLSVHSREWIDFCEDKYDFHRLFDSTMYSFEISILKPDKKAYELILEKLDVKPKECIFIDYQQKNLDSAEELGINTIKFENPEQLKRDFEERFKINVYS
ncbi:MAG: HAD family hydrolase [Candidatus Aenigmatarchaeota archaeon]